MEGDDNNLMLVDKGKFKVSKEFRYNTDFSTSTLPSKSQPKNVLNTIVVTENGFRRPKLSQIERETRLSLYTASKDNFEPDVDKTSSPIPNTVKSYEAPMIPPPISFLKNRRQRPQFHSPSNESTTPYELGITTLTSGQLRRISSIDDDAMGNVVPKNGDDQQQQRNRSSGPKQQLKNFHPPKRRISSMEKTISPSAAVVKQRPMPASESPSKMEQMLKMASKNENIVSKGAFAAFFLKSANFTFLKKIGDSPDMHYRYYLYQYI